jgi:hypothetical protein
MPSPNRQELTKLQEWLWRPSLGSVRLLGRDRKVWSNGEDLLAAQPVKQDFISRRVIKLLHTSYRAIGVRLKVSEMPHPRAHVDGQECFSLVTRIAAGAHFRI